MSKKFRRTAVSLILAVALILSSASVIAFAEGGAKANTVRVKITKTDIIADSVFNTDGYGSICYDPCAGYDEIDLESDYTFKAGLIDRDGNFVFSYKDTYNRYYVDGDIVSLVNGAYYNIDIFYFTNVVRDENGYVEDYDEGMVPDKVGFYSLDGEELFTNEFFGASPYNGRYAFVTTDYSVLSWNTLRSLLIDRSGNTILELDGGFTNVISGGQGGFYTCETYLVTQSKAARFSDGLLLCWSYASEEDYWNDELESMYYIDITGNRVLELPVSEYESAWVFTEGYAGVRSRETGKCGCIDKTGKLVIPCEYDSWSPFNDGLAFVSKDGKCGYINAKNETVIPFEYDDAYGAGSGLAAVVKDDKCGLVDYNNNVVVPIEYDDISSFDKGVAYAIKDRCIYIITKEPSIPGDVNGDGKVNPQDRVILTRYLAKWKGYENIDMSAADVNGDGKVNAQDRVILTRHLAKWKGYETLPYTK